MSLVSDSSLFETVVVHVDVANSIEASIQSESINKSDKVGSDPLQYIFYWTNQMRNTEH